LAAKRIDHVDKEEKNDCQAGIAQLVEQRIRNRISDAMMPGLEASGTRLPGRQPSDG